VLAIGTLGLGALPLLAAMATAGVVPGGLTIHGNGCLRRFSPAVARPSEGPLTLTMAGV